MRPWDQLAHPMGACVLTWTLLYQGGSLDSGACKGNGPGQGAGLEGLAGHRGSASSPPALAHFQEEVWERSPAPGAKALLLPFLTLEVWVQVPGLTSLHPYPLSEPVLGLWEPWVWADRCMPRAGAQCTLRLPVASRWRCRSTGGAAGWAHALQPWLEPQVAPEAPLLPGECGLRVRGQAAVQRGLRRRRVSQRRGRSSGKPSTTFSRFLPSVSDASGVVPLRQPGQPLMPVSWIRR